MQRDIAQQIPEITKRVVQQHIVITGQRAGIIEDLAYLIADHKYLGQCISRNLPQLVGRRQRVLPECKPSEITWVRVG